MPLTNAGKALTLDALDASSKFVSLHSAFPGNSGASEISGGTPAYARRQVTFAGAASGSKSASNQPLFNVPPSTTFAFWGLWSAVTGGTLLGYGALGATSKLEFTTDPAQNQIESPAHGLSDGDTMVFINGNAPVGLTEGVIYFVVQAATNSFKLAVTQGGSEIDITGTENTAFLLNVTSVTSGGQNATYSLPSLTING